MTPFRHQAIIRTSADDDLMSIWPLWKYLIEFVINNLTFPLMQMNSKILSAKWRIFWRGPNMLKERQQKDVLFSNIVIVASIV